MQKHLIFSTVIMITGSIFLNGALAKEPKAIWGTDGAAITKQKPKIAPILPSSVKPVVPIKQPVNTATDIKEAPAPIIPTTATDKLRDDPWAGSQ